MKIDLGLIGKAIGWAIGFILLGALASTGLGVLVGKGAHDTPMFFADAYYGWTGEEFTLDQETEFLGLTVVNEDWKFLGIFPMDGPYTAGRSEGALEIAGEDPAEAGGTDWNDTPDTVDDSPADTPADTPAEAVDDTPAEAVDPNIALCNAARATLTSLKGIGGPYEVREAANAVLAVCTDSSDVETATNALIAAQQDIAVIEAAEAERQAAIDTWAIVENSATSIESHDYAGATTIVEYAGGSYFFTNCPDLYTTGVLENIAGGGEDCEITVYPPEQIEDVASSVSFMVDLKTLWDWGIGDEDATFNRIPESGVYELVK